VVLIVEDSGGGLLSADLAEIHEKGSLRASKCLLALVLCTTG